MTILVAGVIILYSLFSSQVKPASASLGYDHVVDVWDRAWDEILQYTPAGQYYKAVFSKHSIEVEALTINDPVHIMRLWQAAEKFVPGLEAMLDGKGDMVQITEEQVNALKSELEWLASVGSESLRADIEMELQRFPLEQFVGMTMNEALDYLNANVSSIPTPEPTPIADVTNTPAPDPVDQCVAGYDPDCLAGPTLVPGTEGRWAFYELNGVYFEYPSAWRVELEKDRTDLVHLVPVGDWPENVTVDGIPLFAGTYPEQTVTQYDPLTYPQTMWLRPVPYWKRLVTLPDITGSEFLWSEYWNRSMMYAEAIFYDPATELVAGALLPILNDPPNESLRNANQVQELYPNFHHIVESFRLRAPEWVGQVAPEATIPVARDLLPPVTVASATDIPHSLFDAICLAGHDPLCPTTPSLVPESGGKWAYYVLNGVYFEYPNDWDIQQKMGSSEEIIFKATPESPEGQNASQLAILITPIPVENWAQTLTNLPPEWTRPNTVWRELIYLSDFSGFENLWKYPDAANMNLETFLYNENTQMTVNILALVSDPQTVALLNSQSAAVEMFPNIHHIIDSLRLWQP